jgi:hypothetical protein
MVRSLYLFSAIFVLLLSGCGGGGSSTSTSKTDAHEGKNNFLRANWEEVNKPGESSLGVLTKSLDNNLIEINLVKGNSVGEHIQFFIDSDYNEATGYSNDWVDGADYLIEDGRIYKSTANGAAWNWERVGVATFSNTADKIYAQTTTDIIKNISNKFRVSAMSRSGESWDIVSYILMKPIRRGLITVDASSDDWVNIPIQAESPMGKLKAIDDDKNIYFLIEEGNLGQHIQIYLNIDKDVNTGHSSYVLDNQSGAEYMIEDDRLYKSTANDDSWSWQKVGNVKFAKDNNLVEIAVLKDNINVTNAISSISIGAVGWDASFDNYVGTISMQNISLQDVKGLVINEVMAVNAHTIMDPDYLKFSDWIEIYNQSANPIDLSNYKLSDKLNKASWTIPQGTVIEGFGYMLFWADKKDKVKKGYHTNFSLKSKGESVGLFDSHGTLIDGFDFPAQEADISCTFGNNGNLVYMHPTPNSDNTQAIDQLSLSAKPIFSIASAFYENAQNVELSANNGATIYYTIDGSFPTLQSSIYQAPISVDKTTVIRARALEGDKLLSYAKTQTYLIGENTSLPVVSIATDDKYLNGDKVGIYTVGTNGAPAEGCEEGPQIANFYQSWKRPANIDYFDENRVLGFSQEFDIKISGGCSRWLPEKSLSVKADSKYEYSSLKYKLFPHKNINKIKGFKLRSASQDWEGTMLRDAFMHQVIKDDMDVEYQDYRPCVVFINGKYWGIHNIREKKNETFLAENHPEVDPKKVDILQEEGYVNEGHSTDYEALIAYIKDHSLVDTNNYNEVASKMDIENYIDYIVAETYFANMDWPYTNVRFWRDQNGGKWRWILEDLDLALGEPWGDFIEKNMLEMLMSTENLTEQNPLWSTFLFRSLVKNESFKTRFKEKYNSYLNTTFQTDRVITVLDNMTAAIAPEIPRHVLKWKDGTQYVFKSFEEWNDNVLHLKDVIRGRNDVVRQELLAF